MNYTIGDLGVGAAIGYGASRPLDRATGWYVEQHQSKQSKRPEQELGGSEEAEEEQRVLYPLVYGLQGGDVVGIRLGRQAEVD